MSCVAGIQDDVTIVHAAEVTELPTRDRSMSVKLTIRQLQEQLPELLDRAVETGEHYIVQLNGKDYAVVVSAREWKRRAVGKRLDALGPAHRLVTEKHKRAEALLSKNKEGRLTQTERRELDTLLRECDAIMLRRAEAMDQLF
jgi:prevent-host-death family protein